MNCPQCKVALVMSERQGVEIDYCPNCRGVWLDRGELDKIVERSERFDEERRSAAPARRDDDRDRQYHEKAHRRKSFWHELFD